ncbi:3'(2'),5'-bisphosphate nucleotidase CysQ [Magnetospira sp. QH-2]|uniref:3'(2'),5'-bisphosphate nucleotidase CysQ n=1 Tax=Magnetospira sp. (strain QH-2) TaxID=1288970 RepID=UPI00208E98C2|nr:3'(2'),5'-bisphosphate nucleotidase CysQ [Magnetospira sp. QH-2]
MDAVRDIALRAGARIMEIYESDFAVEAKDDKSPVTEADQQAEDLILAALANEISGKLIDAYPVVAEESVAAGRVPDVTGTPFWLVDPLDGTKEFVHRRGEFTVNIALVVDKVPVMGVVLAPALNNTMYWGSPLGAFMSKDGGAPQAISTREMPADGINVVGSRSHRSEKDEAFLSQFTVANMTPAGSSLKFCKVATGEADLYPRMGRTMEWDTGAGHAVVSAAGGRVTDPDGNPFTYVKPDFANDSGFVVWGR